MVMARVLPPASAIKISANAHSQGDELALDNRR